MLNNLWKHVSQIWRFSGREGLKAFWTYAGFVLAGLIWAMMAIMMPIMRRMFATAERIAQTHPDDVTVTRGPGQYSVQVRGNHPELMPDFAALSASILPILLVAVVLLAAAVARRLHDRGLAGWWGMLPLPFLITGLAMMPKVAAKIAGKPDFDMTLFFVLFANNAIYLASLGILVFLLIKPGDAAANRWGAPPADPGTL